MKKLFVGKLSLSTTDATLRNLFAKYEPLASVRVIADKFTGESRGFAFIEIDNDESAKEAIETLNGAPLDGRTIVVNEARPQDERPKNFDDRSNHRNSYGPRQSNYRSSSRY